jgi:hypothetical protein
MTAMGKLLVFLVLVLTLVWNGLVVNTYVGRTNWRKEAVESNKKAKEATDSATTMDGLYKAQQVAHEDEKRALYQDNKRLADRIDAYKKTYEDLLGQYNELFKSLEAQGRDNASLQANIKKLMTQVESQDVQITALNKEINELTLKSEADKAFATQARLEADSQKAKSERLGYRLQELYEKYQDLEKQGGGGVGGPRNGPLDRVPATPEGFRGTVVKVDGNFIEFTPGLDAGLQKGSVLVVQRKNPAAYLGKITVISVDPKAAVGQFTPPTGKVLKPGDYPKPGDEVTPDR